MIVVSPETSPQKLWSRVLSKEDCNRCMEELVLANADYSDRVQQALSKLTTQIVSTTQSDDILPELVGEGLFLGLFTAIKTFPKDSMIQTKSINVLHAAAQKVDRCPHHQHPRSLLTALSSFGAVELIFKAIHDDTLTDEATSQGLIIIKILMGLFKLEQKDDLLFDLNKAGGKAFKSLAKAGGGAKGEQAIILACDIMALMLLYDDDISGKFGFRAKLKRAGCVSKVAKTYDKYCKESKRGSVLGGAQCRMAANNVLTLLFKDEGDDQGIPAIFPTSDQKSRMTLVQQVFQLTRVEDMDSVGLLWSLKRSIRPENACCVLSGGILQACSIVLSNGRGIPKQHFGILDILESLSTKLHGSCLALCQDGVMGLLIKISIQYPINQRPLHYEKQGQIFRIYRNLLQKIPSSTMMLEKLSDDWAAPGLTSTLDKTMFDNKDCMSIQSTICDIIIILIEKDVEWPYHVRSALIHANALSRIAQAVELYGRFPGFIEKANAVAAALTPSW